MALTKPEAKPVKVAQSRVLDQTAVHVVESKILRADGKGSLATAIIDLEKGSVQLTQDTRPITFKSAEDLDDLIEFYTNARTLLANAPKSVLAE